MEPKKVDSKANSRELLLGEAGSYEEEEERKNWNVNTVGILLDKFSKH